MSARLLLDTHVLIWTLSTPNRLQLAVRRDIANSNAFVKCRFDLGNRYQVRLRQAQD